MNKVSVPQIDVHATGMSDRKLFCLGAQINRGYRRFFEKRGIDPDDLPEHRVGRQRKHLKDVSDF